MAGIPFPRFRTLLYGSSRWRHNPREYHYIDLCSAGPQQCPGAGIDRGAGRQHIVDQYRAPTGNLCVQAGQEMPLGRYRRARFEIARPAAV